VSSPFAQENGPQPPKVLKTPLEIVASLRPLQQNHIPLKITFHERSQYFRSYVISIDQDSNTLLLDEMIPSIGERYLQNGEAFHVEAVHDGVLIAWDSPGSMLISEYEGARCYRGAFPEQVLYHQRRNAFRASLKQLDPVQADLGGRRLRASLQGQLINVSASGCKVRLAGNVVNVLQSGEVYESFSVLLPEGRLEVAVELRHVYYDEKFDFTFVGLRFVDMSGIQQRLIDRFVYQLQREARRKGTL
jgi:c-di-GMP-binding flagellar brake protein YcgR